MGLNIGQIDPQTIQKLLYGGPQGAMFQPMQDPLQGKPVPQDPAAAPAPDPTPGAQPPSDTPPRGSLSSSMPQQQAPAASAPGYSSTPPTFDEYQATHGDVPLKAPTPAPHRGMLSKIMLGLGEVVGNPYATRIGESDRKLGLENQEFERNKPALQYSSNRAAYEQDLGNLEKVAQTRRSNIEADLAQQNIPLQEAAEKHYHELEDAWVSKAVPPEQFDTYAQMQLSAMPPAIARMVQPHLAGIKQLPQTGKGYKLNMQDDMPVSVESYGKTYQPDAKGGFGPEVPPQAVQDFTAAQQAHATKRGEKREDEKSVAGYAATRQAQAFSNAEHMKNVDQVQPRVNTALDADERLSRMERAYAKGLKGDQQAMLALLTDHIGMTMGLQKGARITKDILNEAQGSMPWLEKIGAKFDDRGLLSGAALGPEQMRQMLDLGYEARDRAYGSAHDAATTYGVPLPKGMEQVERKRVTGAKPAIEEGKPQVKVGQTVSVKGKQVKITAVHPDGSFDAQ